MNTGISSALEQVLREAERANTKYGDFTSTHEALGVLLEEFEELRDAVHSNGIGAIGREALQVSAVALRLFHICQRAPAAFVERST